MNTKILKGLSTRALVDRIGLMQADIAEREAEYKQARAELMSRVPGNGKAEGSIYTATISRNVPRSSVPYSILGQYIEQALLAEITNISHSDRVQLTAKSIHNPLQEVA